ncbi:heterokaryon incompatibility protein-domain-containing protein [Lasiosphaeria hispida]|uniref:Heterokaryon incompatibility protein-domain-containing protein n=1 Tax=Lasiosphaeria hispida TaxID=260671 RepID=A0AAJ0MBU3_9PEZI|nr:heterokaryon incompatibility protein-domain-containing protein [Lasiosphaeria hispida]
MDQNAASSNGNPTFTYTPLPSGCIRLLRLSPHFDTTARIHCQLFDYPATVQHSAASSHLYEALSYVWGSSEKQHAITVTDERGDFDLPVTANLHAALAHLRNPLLDRMIWVDAVCINQEDNMEKAKQIQRMAEIYSHAARVVVWLGDREAEGGDDSEVLESLRVVASGIPFDPLFLADGKLKEKVVALVNRPWFNRIWVLQEVAAARSVLIKCGSAEVDGFAFCWGLELLSPTLPELRGRGLPPAIALIRGANFRSKQMAISTERFSLNLSPFGELVDRYQACQATVRHDKVFSLLGMSSDDWLPDGLLPNYEQPWEDLLQRLVRYLIGDQVSVETWPDTEMVVVRGVGRILAAISDISFVAGTQVASLTPTKSSGWAGLDGGLPLQAWAKPLQVGDLVCILQGALGPVIVRPHADYFSIVVTCPPFTVENEDLNPEQGLEYNFLLVWDWETEPEISPGKESEFAGWLGRRVPQCLNEEAQALAGKQVRLRDKAFILEDMGEYEQASLAFLEVGNSFQQDLGKENLYTLEAKERIALLHNKMGEADKASAMLQEIMKARKGLQGVGHADTFKSVLHLVAIYHQNNARAWGPVAQVYREGSETRTEEDVISIAESCSAEQVAFLLDWDVQFPITEGVLEAAARNTIYGDEVVELLLARAGKDIDVTERILVAAAGNCRKGEHLLDVLLSRYGGDVPITGEMLVAAAANVGQGEEAVKLLLKRRKGKVRVTSAMLTAAVGNGRYGQSISTQLLERGENDTAVTFEVFMAAWLNWRQGRQAIQVILNPNRTHNSLLKMVHTGALFAFVGSRLSCLVVAGCMAWQLVCYAMLMASWLGNLHSWLNWLNSWFNRATVWSKLPSRAALWVTANMERLENVFGWVGETLIRYQGREKEIVAFILDYLF